MRRVPLSLCNIFPDALNVREGDLFFTRGGA